MPASPRLQALLRAKEENEIGNFLSAVLGGQEEVGGISADRYMEIMDRSPYSTGIPMSVGYDEDSTMSPLDMAAIVSSAIPVVGDVTGLAADADMYARDPESRNMVNYLLSAAGAIPLIPAASQVARLRKIYENSPNDSVAKENYFEARKERDFLESLEAADARDRPKIKAFHSSPHDFDEFSTDYIGTGEGAQAYGRGLYFAENPDTAGSYRKSFEDSNPPRLERLRVDDTEMSEANNFDYSDIASLDTRNNIKASLIEDLLINEGAMREFSDGTKKTDFDRKEMALDYLNTKIEDEISYINQKITKELEPDPKKRQLLKESEMAYANEAIRLRDDIANNPESIQAVFNESTVRTYEVELDVADDDLLDWDAGIDEQPEKIKKALGNTDWFEYAEQGAINKADRRGDNATGQDLVNYMEEDGPEFAAQQLQDAGIKGIKYADAFTRHKSAAKHKKNYVIFDARLISIAKKYGIAIPVAAAMLAKETGQDPQELYQEDPSV
jgi:hypothetical protein